jgi:ABC-type phosphate transport system substrate-binding protein
LGYTSWGTPANTNTIAFLDSASGVVVTTTPYPEIQFSGSDAYLNSTQVSNAQASVGETVFQLPTFATPITLPVGLKSGVKLTTADVCNLFAGATNVTSGKVTISELVVRSDGSGTSFILSDWLAQNCSASLGFNSSNGFPSTKPSWAAVAAANGNHLGTPVAVSGSGGIASTVASTQNALGYVSPDYDYPIVSSSTAYSAQVNGQSPSVTAVKNHLTHANYPTSYNVLTIGQQVNDSLVAPSNTAGYPIVGYTFLETYSCYSTSIAGGLIGGPAQGKQLLALAQYLYGTSPANVTNILTSQGFVQAGTAITTLLKGTGGPLNATGGIQNSSCPSS